MRTLTLAFIAGSTLMAGCARNSTDLDSASMAIDSSDSVESEGNMMMAVTDGADATSLTAGVTSDQVAARIAANVALRWQPSNCATVTTSGSNVTIKFADCTGPRGLLHVTGELDLAVSITTAGDIAVHGTASGLEVNHATLDIDTDATYGVSGTEHTLTVHTTGSGVGGLGNEIDHSGDYTVSWDSVSLCGSIDGSWSTEITTANASATRSNDANLSRCAGGCPTGSLVHHGLLGLTVSITFDGTATASWSTSNGRSGTFALQCQ